MDDGQRYEAVAGKDARFDGVFFTGVTSTGIYCRPSCPAITPKRANMRFYPSAAAAQEAGFRACKRCRPDTSPGSQRAQTARVLIETTTLPLSDIAFAAGFASIRQFNDTIRTVFASTPGELRERAAQRGGEVPTPATLRLRLAYRPPIDVDRIVRFLGARAIPGVEAVSGG